MTPYKPNDKVFSEDLGTAAIDDFSDWTEADPNTDIIITTWTSSTPPPLAVEAWIACKERVVQIWGIGYWWRRYKELWVAAGWKLE